MASFSCNAIEAKGQYRPQEPLVPSRKPAAIYARPLCLLSYRAVDSLFPVIHAAIKDLLLTISISLTFALSSLYFPLYFTTSDWVATVLA